MKTIHNLGRIIVAIVLIIFLESIRANTSNELEMLTSLPSHEKIERFELVDERLNETKYQISSTNKLAIKQLVEWLKVKARLPFDPKWQGSYRPILVIRFWMKDTRNPKQLAITHEWKDAQGKISVLSGEDVGLLMSSILKSCQNE